ncbi:hypothetical protein AB9M62_52995, partial [Bacillales bacterium AN1005]
VKNPFGDVAFFHYGKTKSMVEAKQQITNSNKEAAKKGMPCLGWEEENELYDLLKLIKASFKLD